MLTLFRSHSIDVLAGVLAQRLQDDVRNGVVNDPVAPQEVLVRTHAMGRWLALRLSEVLQPAGDGICANIRFPNGDRYLRNLVAKLAAVDDLTQDPWHPRRLRWSLAAELRQLHHHPEPDPLWQPLLQLWRSAPADRIDRYRLRILMTLADRFDHYTLYRQEMVLGWLQGQSVDGQGDPLVAEQRWQAALYQRVHRRLGGHSPAERLEHAQQHLAGAQGQAWCRSSQNPGPLRLFCLGHLPIPYLDLVAAIAHHELRAVELFVLTPSAQPWSSIQERQRLMQQVDALRDYMGLLRANGHRLLASLGKTMRQFQAILDRLQQQQPMQVIDRFPSPLTETGQPDPPTGVVPSLLDGLRGDMLKLVNRDRLASDPAWQSRSIPATDDTIKVLHCCSDLGQVEALRRWLLLLFDRHRQLQPRDVLVMTPDVAGFAPLMQAVFEPSGGDDVHLPLHVSDRPQRQENPLLNLALLLLELTDERLEPSQLLDLLLNPLINRQFGLGPGDGPAIARLMKAMGVHWGIDADHRHRLGLPRDEVHTWRWGLGRLALALALEDPVAEILTSRPLGHHSTTGDSGLPQPQQGCWSGLAAVPLRDDQIPLAHRLLTVLPQLINAIDGLAPPRSRQQWATDLRTVLFQLVSSENLPGDGLVDLHIALDGLAGLPLEGNGGSNDPVIDAAAAQCLLEESAGDAQGYQGHQNGAVTLAALNPMRSIPNPVICLLGMDEDRIPRRDVRPAYDLMAAHPHPGDRDRCHDDQGLLLEAVLACGGWLVVTFTGMDPRTGEERNPASPISELLTCLDRGFDLEAANGVVGPTPLRDHLVQREPALPVDPLLYQGHGESHGAPLRCFDTAGLAAARVLEQQNNRPEWDAARTSMFPVATDGDEAPRPPATEPGPQESGDGPALSDLLTFWKDPHQQFLRVHQLAPPRHPGEPPGVETDELNGLERWQLHQMLLLHLMTSGGTSPTGTERDHNGNNILMRHHLSRSWAEGLQRRGFLPPADAGRGLLRREEIRIGNVLARAEAQCRDGGAVHGEPMACTVQLPTDGSEGRGTSRPRCLEGNLDGLWLPQRQRRLQLSAGKLARPDRLLQRWIEHLFLNVAKGGGWRSIWIGFDQRSIDLELDPLESPMATSLLTDLVILREEGLHQPLDFEPELGWHEQLQWVSEVHGSAGKGPLGRLKRQGGSGSGHPSPSWRLLHPAWCSAPRAWSQRPAASALRQRVLDPLVNHVGDES